MKVLGRSATPAVPLVLVEVHAVPTSLAIQGPEAKQTIENIIKQNYTLAGVERLA
jgi:hypothetical protein